MSNAPYVIARWQTALESSTTNGQYEYWTPARDWSINPERAKRYKHRDQAEITCKCIGRNAKVMEPVPDMSGSYLANLGQKPAKRIVISRHYRGGRQYMRQKYQQDAPGWCYDIREATTFSSMASARRRADTVTLQWRMECFAEEV